MPIVFVHGVATREPGFEQSWAEIEQFLRHYAAPEVAADPRRVAVERAYCGDAASAFRFGGVSRPRSWLLGMGLSAGSDQTHGSADTGGAPLAVADLESILPILPPPATSRLAAAGPAAAGSGSDARPLTVLDPTELSDLAAACAPNGLALSPRAPLLPAETP